MSKTTPRMDGALRPLRTPPEGERAQLPAFLTSSRLQPLQQRHRQGALELVLEVVLVEACGHHELKVLAHVS